MRFIKFIICLFCVAIFPETFAEWEALLPIKTNIGETCITPCEQRGSSYYWCYVQEGKGRKSQPHDNYGGDLGRCSPRPGVSIKGHQCHDECRSYENRYFFCYTNVNNSSWDFCVKVDSFTPSITVVPQLKTFNGVDCVTLCEETPGYKAWCYKASGGWDYCSSKPVVSSQLVYTYVGAKCVTPCQPLGSGKNYCYDASKTARLCSRVQGLTVNNEICQTNCDLQGGNSSAPFQEYFWCWTNDARTTWDYCSNIDDNPSLGKGRRIYPKSRISLQFTKSNSLENIHSYQDDQRNSRVTFLENLPRSGNETFYNIHNRTKLQKWALECLESWRGNEFKLPISNDTPILTAGAVTYQHTKYEFLCRDYIEMQLQVNICKDRLHAIAEVHAPINLIEEYPEEVYGAFLTSINNQYAVHIGRFNYDPESEY